MLNQANSHSKHHAAPSGPKYSDQLANGDPSDDREIQDVQDPRDAIVDEHGFVNQYRTNWGHSKDYPSTYNTAQKKKKEWQDYEGV